MLVLSLKSYTDFKYINIPYLFFIQPLLKNLDFDMLKSNAVSMHSLPLIFYFKFPEKK